MQMVGPGLTMQLKQRSLAFKPFRPSKPRLGKSDFSSVQFNGQSLPASFGASH